MKLPNSAHTSRPWRIHEIAPDFKLEDVWALPVHGTRDEFPQLVRQFASGDTMSNPSRIARVLFAIRWKLGELLGWDKPSTGLGSRVLSLRDRLPADTPPGPEFPRLPFKSIYLTDDEWAAEIANKTVHGILHIGWLPSDDGTYHGQMAILVKPNGLLGKTYMTAIAPLRHLIVYPALFRGIAESGKSNQLENPRHE